MTTKKRATCIHGVELIVDKGNGCFECERQARVIGLPADARMVDAPNAMLAAEQGRESAGAKSEPAPTLSERIGTATENAKNGKGLREDKLRALFDSLRSMPVGATVPEADDNDDDVGQCPHEVELADLRAQHRLLEKLYLEQRTELHELAEDFRNLGEEAQTLRAQLVRIGKIVKRVTEAGL